MMVDDAARKITMYSNLANMLLLGGVLLMIVAVWMFFHFGAPRMIARVTGYGAKREREKFLKEQQKTGGTVNPPSGDPSHQNPSGDAGIYDTDFEDLYMPPSGTDGEAPPPDAEQGNAQDESPAANEDGDVDMSVWDNTSALKAMLDEAGKPGKRYGTPQAKGGSAKPEIPRKRKEQTNPPTDEKPIQAAAPAFAETGLLEKRGQGRTPGRDTTGDPVTGKLDRGISGDPGTGVLENRQAGTERNRNQPEGRKFRIVRCIRVSAEIPENASTQEEARP